MLQKCLTTTIKIETKVRLHVKAVTNGQFKVYPQTLFSYLLAMQRITKADVWNRFLSDFDKLIQNYKSVLEFKRLGLPAGWEQFLLYKH